MTYEQMKLIVDIAHCGTLSAVAEKNNISHSAISRSISNLENTLGIVLFKRTRKGSALTDEGKKAVEIAQQIVALYQQLEALKCDAGLADNIRIGSSTMEASSVVFQTIQSFKSIYPNVTLHFSKMPLSDVAAQLQRYEIDIGLSFLMEEEFRKLSKNFRCQKLLTTHLVILFSSQSPLAKKERVTMEDLREYKFVLQDDIAVISTIKRLMGTNHLSVFSHSNQDSFVKEMVAQGEAVTFSPEIFVQNHPLVLSGELKYLPVANGQSFYLTNYTCYYLPNKPLSIPKKKFVTLLQKNVREQYQPVE